MSFIGATAQHLLCSNSRTLRKCQPFKGSIVQLAFSVPRRYSTSSTPFRRKGICLANAVAVQSTVPIRRRIAIGFPRTRRGYATTPIVQEFEHLPSKYKDKHGLPFRVTALSQDETSTIFGPGVNAGVANRVVKIIHGRRVAGTLADPSLGFPISGVDDRIQTIALSWLRENVSVDEEESAARRAEIELGLAEAEALAEGERLEHYRPNSGRAASDKENGGRDKTYGESGLDYIKEAYRQRRLLLEEAEATQKKNTDKTHRSTANSLTTGRSRVELQTPAKEHPWKKYYLERAKVLPTTVPEMSVWQRVWPSGAVTLLVVGLSVTFAMVYTPPKREVRIWPDLPPAAATIFTLIAMNVAIFALWHHPPAFRLLNKYFVSVPGYPRALATLGSMFSHQQFRHLLSNMVLLWLFGTRLHDEIGRGNFLAIYLSAGVVSCFGSLSMFSYLRNFATSSVGASGSIYGVIAAFLWLHRYDSYKFLGLPPDPMPGIPGFLPLIVSIVFDVWNVRKAGKPGSTMDHYAHLGGFAVGMVSAEILERRARARQHLELERRKRLVVLEGRN